MAAAGIYRGSGGGVAQLGGVRCSDACDCRRRGRRGRCRGRCRPRGRSRSRGGFDLPRAAPVAEGGAPPFPATTRLLDCVAATDNPRARRSADSHGVFSISWRGGGGRSVLHENHQLGSGRDFASAVNRDAQVVGRFDVVQEHPARRTSSLSSLTYPVVVEGACCSK